MFGVDGKIGVWMVGTYYALHPRRLLADSFEQLW